MADLGSIAELGNLTQPLTIPNGLLALRTVQLMDTYEVIGARDNTEGDPAQPSLRMDSKGMWRFRWGVSAGSHDISINVMQAVNQTPRPTLVVKANPSIGVNADVTESAASSTGWVTIGPATITPSSAGAVWVELHANYDAQLGSSPCYWDHIVTT